MSALGGAGGGVARLAVPDRWTRRRRYSASIACARKRDVATLGNLCVDIVLRVPCLPPPCPDAKLQFLRQLESCPPQHGAWEAGGICNFTIAAARLGLECVSIGHIGDERFGKFLTSVLDKEGVDVASITGDFEGSTLLCWVLVDPEHHHAFCSRFDFKEAPLLDKMHTLLPKAQALIKNSKALHLNGFVFDELVPAVVLSAVECAHDAGSAVFFDPGPRGESLFREDRGTLERILELSHVLLLTADEAATLTGINNPYAAAKVLLSNGIHFHTKWVIVKMGSRGSLLASKDGCHHVPGFKVDVIDTVGCGDSFAAAVVMGYNRGLPATTTLTLANAVGAATAMGSGAGRNVATMSKVLRVLSSSEFESENDSHLLLRQDTTSLLENLASSSCKSI